MYKILTVKQNNEGDVIFNLKKMIGLENASTTKIWIIKGVCWYRSEEESE